MTNTERAIKTLIGLILIVSWTLGMIIIVLLFWFILI